MRLSVLETGGASAASQSNVILLHGLLGRARNLGILQRALSPFFRTISLDLRSHGSSPHDVMTYPSMVEDVLETLDQLNIHKAAFFGHSMGGKVAMALALSAPERVTKLCVADIAPAPMHHGSRQLIETLSTLSLPALQNRTELRNFLLPSCGNDDIANLVGQNISPGAPAQWDIGFDDITRSLDAIEGWPSTLLTRHWDGPVLFIKGEFSPYIEPQHHDLIHKLFPKAKIRTLAGTNHWLHIEKPVLFNQMVLDFFEGRHAS
ncbi:alpha/beta fold hydrolase [Acetobacteraceae bacterium ESL0709]|nr:alpha/beta fold hydrolase [Acetobacteraceae bacterium ESL0697]MDF7678967.1 alpha/beta fold hydrolase [Acetobacteraceae bacterium ESL0709]